MRGLTRQETDQILRSRGFRGLNGYTETDPDMRDPAPGLRSPEAFTGGQGNDGGLAINQVRQWANLNNGYLTPFVIADSSTQIFSSSNRRTMLLIQNLSSGSNLYFNIGSGAGPSNGILLLPQTGFVFDSVCPYNSLFAYFDTITPQLGVALEVRLDPET